MYINKKRCIKGCVNMLKLIKGRLKNFIGIIALACFCVAL